MDFLRGRTYSEINLKEDIDKVRALAMFIDKPILFIDPMDKAKQILVPVF